VSCTHTGHYGSYTTTPETSNISDGAIRCLKVGVHKKTDLLEAFHERRMRECGEESGGPPFPSTKLNLGLAEVVQFPAVLRGLLALFSLFLVDILSRSQFLPTPPISTEI